MLSCVEGKVVKNTGTRKCVRRVFVMCCDVNLLKEDPIPTNTGKYPTNNKSIHVRRYTVECGSSLKNNYVPDKHALKVKDRIEGGPSSR
jgi:hypothetical protein